MNQSKNQILKTIFSKTVSLLAPLFRNKCFLKIFCLILQLFLAYVGWKITAATIVESWLNSVGFSLIIFAVLLDNILSLVLSFLSSLKAHRS